MYDQTGQTGEGSAADYNNHHDGQGFNPEDIFGQFKGYHGQHNAGGFEDIFNDLFGGGHQQKNRRNKPQHQQYDASPITMNVVLNFEESVKGATKVCATLVRLSSSNASASAQPVKVKEADLELSPKNADLVQGQARRLSGRVCSS